MTACRFVNVSTYKKPLRYRRDQLAYQYINQNINSDIYYSQKFKLYILSNIFPFIILYSKFYKDLGL